MSSRLLDVHTASALVEERFPECPHLLKDPRWSGMPVRLFEEDVALETLSVDQEILLFAGDLRVHGWIKDKPESLLLVCGDLKAKDILTRGNICVRRDTFVERLLSGYSSQGHSFWGGGDLQSAVLLESEHRWHCFGRLHLFKFSGRLSRVQASSYRIAQHIEPSELFLHEVLQDPDDLTENLWAAVREDKPFLRNDGPWS